MENKEPSSRYRGVSSYKRTAKWNAHGYNKKTKKQVYLGIFLKEEEAARRVDKYDMDQQYFEKLNFHDSKQFLEDTSAAARSALAKHLAAQGSSGQSTSKYTSNLVGVSYSGKKFPRARIRRDGVLTQLGTYNTPEDAQRAYAMASSAYEKVKALTHGDPNELFSYLSTNEANADNFLKVCLRYISDILIQNIILLYHVIYYT
jgi:hypothetical protein